MRYSKQRCQTCEREDESTMEEGCTRSSYIHQRVEERVLEHVAVSEKRW
jgi:hypothetical protein